MHIHTVKLDKETLGQCERHLTICYTHKVAAHGLVGVDALTHIHCHKVEVCRPPLCKLERQVYRGVVVVQGGVVYSLQYQQLWILCIYQCGLLYGVLHNLHAEADGILIFKYGSYRHRI